MVDVTAAAGSTPAFRWQNIAEPYASFQSEITALASVSIQGRMAPDAPWIPLFEFNTITLETWILRPMPEMRCVWTGNTGTVNLWIMA